MFINSFLKIIRILLFCSFVVTISDAQFTYPSAKKVEVVENYHGTTVADPYRWMEEENTADLNDWIERENDITQEYLTIPEREKIKSRLTALWNFPKYSVPSKRGERYFFSKNDGLQNQSVIYVQKQLHGDAKIVIDPNTLSSDGTVALSNTSFSEDGSFFAYGISKSGSDWQEIKIKNLETEKEYSEILQWCKFASIAWKHDNSGFYYNRFPDPSTVGKGQESFNNKVYWHKIGTPQSSDALVYERTDAKELSFSPSVTEDGKYVILHVWKGTDNENRIYYRDVESNGAFIRLLDNGDASYNFITNDGTTFYFQTNLNAPKEKILAIDITKPERKHWKEIIPEQKEPIAFTAIVNNNFVVAYLKDAHHLLKVFEMNGTYVEEIPLPVLGSIAGLSGKKEDKEMFFGYTSFLFPTTIYRYDFVKHSLAVFREPQLSFDASQYDTRQIFYYSKDGAKIPMFITHKKEITLDGSNPALLYGYGGFNVNITPSFSVSRFVWLEMGGVYAVANLRGGSEYGEDWHKAGMLHNKQNVFDDFIYAAKWLIENKYTSRHRLAIIGGSNGGLLTAACMTQQPQLFGAVICQVPVIDMLRYHKFTVGRYWIGEYGNAEENSEHFKFMFAYSPLHNIKSNVEYPPTLITTADHDDRVVPAHAMKFAATLQEHYLGNNPILVRIETKAGHGGGKPTSKQIEEQSDIYAFLLKIFQLKF
jgi:prolyl oligopeptidase